MVSMILKFRNMYSSKSYLSRRFTSHCISTRALSVICNWNFVYDSAMKEVITSDSTKVQLSCPFGRRTIVLQKRVLPPDSNSNCEELESRHRRIGKAKIRYSDKSPLVAQSTLCNTARLHHHKDASQVETDAAEISNGQDENSKVWDMMRIRTVELRSAVYSGMPLQPACSSCILHYALKIFQPLSEEAATTSLPMAGETHYSFYAIAVGDAITEHTVEVQAWIDCCFFDDDGVASDGSTGDSHCERSMEQSRRLFAARVSRLVSCERQFLSDVLLRLRGESFVFSITRCSATDRTTATTTSEAAAPLESAIKTESTSVVIPLSYLYSVPHGSTDGDVYATAAKKTPRAVENLSPYELFDFYRAESIALVKYRSQLLKDNTLLAKKTNPSSDSRNSSIARPPSLLPATFRMTTPEGSFVAVYDHLLPSSSAAELPLAKISAVFEDRTILQWSIEHPQSLSALLPDGSERWLSIESYYKGHPRAYQGQNPTEYSSDSCPRLYYYSGQLLSFANVARTPEEERREKKRREENMADKVAAVLAQGRRYLAVSSLMDRTDT